MTVAKQPPSAQLTDDQQTAALALSLLDLTSLNDTDTEASIRALCEQAQSIDADGHRYRVAAICIYPRFIPFARGVLDELGLYDVRIATVANFPHGRSDIDSAVKDTKACVAYGADEVDVVLPYQALLNGDERIVANLVTACKQACGTSAQLKVILETGELKSAAMIAKASDIAITAGADFIKTSTGKVAVNATPEAARTMLERIQAQPRAVGFKPAGGVKSIADVAQYFELVRNTVGDDKLSPSYFRFGASSLLATLRQVLNIQEASDSASNSASKEGY